MALDVRQPDRASFADIRRTRIRLWEWGDAGAPPMVLVHGGWDHGRMFDGIAPELAAMGYRVVAVDLRGHGDSGRLSISGACWLTWNLDLARLVQRLGPPAAMVGHSLGGGQVLSVAGAFPELVSWAVSIDGLGPPREVMEIDDYGEMCRQWFADAEAVWTRPQREYPSVEAMAAARMKINVRLPEAWALHLAEHGSRPGPGGGLVWKADPVMRIGGPGPFNEETLLAQDRAVRCPVTVLTGAEHDTWSDLDDETIARRMAVFERGRHVTVDGAGHYIHLERPDAVLSEIARLAAP